MALGYAIKYPAQVQSLIVFNASSRLSQAVAMQRYNKRQAYYKMMGTVDSSSMNQLFDLINIGKAVLPNGRKLTGDKLMEILDSYIMSYKNMYTDFPAYMDQIFAANNIVNSKSLDHSRLRTDHLQDIKDVGINGNNRPMSLSGRFDADTREYINPYLNTFYSCAEFFIEEVINALPLAEMRDLAREQRDLCTQKSMPFSTMQPVDFYADLAKITAPILLVAGVEDILSDISLTDSDYASLSQSNSDAYYLRLEKTGHNFIDDELECARQAVQTFVSTSLTNKTPTCQDLTRLR